MKECGLLWRNQSYEVILGTVLATAAELSRFRGHALPIPPATPLENLNLSYNASTPPASAAISPAVLHASTPCSPNLVQASLAASDDASHCPDPSCKALFTGSSQTTNLRRHLRTALHHNQDAKFECGICRVTFGRPDNLQQHIRNVHGLDPALKHHQRTRISSQSRGARG